MNTTKTHRMGIGVWKYLIRAGQRLMTRGPDAGNPLTGKRLK